MTDRSYSRALRAPDAGGTGDPAAPAPDAAPAAPDAAPAADPFAGWSAEDKALYESKGWTADEAGHGAVRQAYRELEKMVGTDKLALPAKGDDGNRDFAKWDGWKQLGAYDKPEDVVFDLGGQPETPYTEMLHGALRPAVHAARLAPWQLKLLNDAFSQFEKDAVAAQGAEEQRIVGESKTGLAEKWGGAYDRKTELGERLIDRVFGGDAKKIDGLRHLQLTGGGYVLDHPLVRELLGEAGELAPGEDSELVRGGTPSARTMTPEQVQTEIDALKADPDAVKALSDSSHLRHEEFKRKMNDLMDAKVEAQRRARAAAEAST